MKMGQTQGNSTLPMSKLEPRRSTAALFFLAFAGIAIASLNGAGAQAQTLPTITFSNPHTSGLEEGKTTKFEVAASPSLNASLPVTFQFTRTGDFMDPNRNPSEQNFANCMSGDGTGKAACPYDLDLFDYDLENITICIRTEDDDIDEPDGTLTMMVEYGEGLTSNSVTVDMLDNDPTMVSLARVGSEVISDGGAAAFTVTLGRALVAGEVIDVPLAISGPGVSADGHTLSLTSGTGATLSGTNRLTPTLRFSGAGAQTATLELRPAAASTVERYRIALGPDGAGANGFDRAGLGTNVGGGADPHGIQNSFHVWKDLGHPSVTITGGPAEMSEGSTASFTLTANPAPSASFTVTVNVTDSGDFATAGQSGSRTVSIGPDGAGSFTVTTVDDGVYELNGAIRATVQVGDGYTVGAPSLASVAVTDNDEGILVKTDAPSGITEGQQFQVILDTKPLWDTPQPATFRFTRTGDFMKLRSCPGYPCPQTGSYNQWLYGDGTGKGSFGWIHNTTGNWGFNLGTVNDSIDEPDGTLTAKVEYGDGLSTNSVTVPIRDDDPTVVSLARTGSGAVSAGSAIAFTTTLGRALVAGETIDVPLAISGAGVSADSYTLSVTSGTGVSLSGTGSLTPTLRFSGAGAQAATLELVPGAGGATGTYTIALGPDGDSANGFDRSGLGTNVGGGADPHATQTSFDVEVTPAQQASEPMPPELSLSSGTGGTEGAAVEFTLSAAPAPSAPLEVTLTVSQTSDHVGSGEIGQRTVTVTASGSVTVSIPTVDDEVDEADGTVTAALAAGSGYTVGGLSSLTVDVVDNDEAVLPLSVDSSCVSEELMGTAERLYERHRHRPPEYAENWFSVLVAFGERTPDQWTADGRTITPMTAASARQRGWGRFATALQCLEDASREVEPVVSITGGDGVPEGDGASFSLRADPAPVSDLAVTVSIGGSGGAVAPSGQGERTVTLPKGEREASFTVATVDDGADGPGGTVTATVVAQEGYTLGDVSTAVVVVKDDDATVVRLSGPAGDVAEAGGAKVLTVALGRVLAAGESLSVPLVLGGVARLGSDYTLSAPGSLPQGVSYAHLGGSEGSSPPTLTFSGPSSAAATVRFTATEDTATEGASETVTVGLGTLTATGLDGGAQGLGTVGFAILEPPPQVGVSAKSAAVTEGGAAVFTVTASRVAESDLSVHLVVSEAGGGDFVAAEQEGAASVSIPKGGREASFTVSTVDDGVDEPDGRVTVTLAVDGEEGQRYTVAAAPKDAASVAVRDNDDAAPTVPTLSVEDATVHEQERLMYFTVRLSPGAEEPVTVSFHTRHASPVSAREYQDYLEMDTSVSFAPKETEKKALVYIFDDSHDEGRETFEVVLSDAKGAVIGDGVAVGAIVNDDPLPAAWLVRFGRTVSHQVVAGIRERFSAPPSASGLHLNVAGEELTGAAPLVENQQVLAKVLGFESVTAQQVVEGSSFSFSPQATAGEQGEGEGGGGRFSLWGQGALASFSGAEDSVSLDGEVTTALVGAEWSTARWQAGAALSHSWGSGDYEGEGHHREGEEGHPGHPGGDGRISSSLSGIFPYGRYALTPRLGVWGVAGAGRGRLSLKPDGDGREYQPDISLGMAAVGIDGLLLDGGPAGLRLTTTTDLLTVSTTSEAVQGLKASDGTVSRLRLGLEAARPFPLSSGASLLPSLEVGIRQDSGDAETGFGLELGTGLSWHDPRRGIRAEMRGRSLLSHADEEFREQGLAVSLAWDPTPTRRGPSLSLSHAVGATAAGGMDALLHPVVLEGLAAPSSEGQQQFETRFAYGFPIFSDQLTLSPALELALSPTSRTYSLLWTVAPYAPQPGQAAPWHLSLEGERQESTTASPTQHSLGLLFSLLF